MLTAEVVDTERTAGEVRPSRNKTGWNHDAGNHKAGRGGVHGARAAVIARIRLPVRPEFAYYAVNHGRMGRSNGKCRFKDCILALQPLISDKLGFSAMTL